MDRILIMGGSYFFGRVYALYAAEDREVYVFNRGTYPPPAENIIQIQGDRNDPADLKKLTGMCFDAVVDFCAYEPGQIRSVAEALGGRFSQYIYVSTADVVSPELKGTGMLIGDESPAAEEELPGENGRYINGKAELESELREVAAQAGAAYTILRPAVLYGPFNYAPREAELIRMMVTAGKVVLPLGAEMKYSFCYIKDAAMIALGLTGNSEAFGRTLLLAGPEHATGEEVADMLIACSGANIEKIFAAEHAMEEAGIPVVFPGESGESRLFDGSEAARLSGTEYTPLHEGMKRTYAAFAPLFSKREG